MSKYARMAATPVPQNEPLNAEQAKNNAGGYVFMLDDWKRLDRFLILGSDAPTYYQKAIALTRENTKVVQACYDADPARTVARIIEISDSGRAPKNSPAIYALALGAAHVDVKRRQLALAAMPKVCRTGTHLFEFVAITKALGRGWGRTLKRAVANWYNSKSTDVVAYQAIKYRQRENYTHKRLMQTAHPSPLKDEQRRALYEWLWGKEVAFDKLPKQVQGHIMAMTTMLPGSTATAAGWSKLVEEYKLPWEALPTEALTSPEVWQAMLPTMGLTALIRNLGNMSRIGAIPPLSGHESLIASRIRNVDNIRQSRVHPFTILQALAVYASGSGFRGKKTWPISARIVDALDDAFNLAFENVEPTGKRIFIGLDVSGSMSTPFGDSPLMVSQAAAAVAMTFMRRESQWYVMGFANGLRDLGLTARQSLASVVKQTGHLTFGGTDCALPMQHAVQNKLEVDAFIVITDNETWAGRIHPVKALQAYRNRTGINAKLVVIGMTSTGFTIADPDDGNMLDVVGMDSNVPSLVSNFIRD